MEEKSEILKSAEETLNSLIELKSKYKKNVLGPSLINIFESVSKFNEQNKQFITDLYKQHESIYEDVLSSFENPNCSCRRRFSDFIDENPESSKEVFVSLLLFLNEKDGQSILKTLKSFHDHFKTLNEKEEEKLLSQTQDADEASKNENAAGQIAQDSDSNNTGAEPSAVSKPLPREVSYIGKSFIINKSKEEYAKFFDNLLEANAQYNGMSVIPFNLNQMMVLFY